MPAAVRPEAVVARRSALLAMGLNPVLEVTTPVPTWVGPGRWVLGLLE